MRSLLSICTVFRGGYINKLIFDSMVNSEFKLVLFQDERIVDLDEVARYLEHERESKIDAYRIRVALPDGRNQFAIRVMRTGSKWRFLPNGSVHHPDEGVEVGSISRAYIEGAKDDLRELEAKLTENPTDPKILVALAERYDDLASKAQDDARITYAMMAMSMYFRRLRLPIEGETAIEEANFYRMRYLQSALWTGIYSPSEFHVRCVELSDADPKRPETALLRAIAGMRALPMERAYAFACAAARLASEAGATESFKFSISDSCEWQAHLLAAEIALQVARKLPEARCDGTGTSYAEAVRQHIAMGIEIGGPLEMFSKVEAALATLPIKQPSIQAAK